MDKKEIIKTAFALAELEISPEQTEQFMAYASLLSEWNGKMNLTAITDFNEVVSKHFIDSLAPMYADLLQTRNIGKKTADIGTGAGFPGIPLKIMNPGMELTLVDSLNKRIDFLNAVIKELGLKKVRTVHARAEDFGRDPLNREKYDLCVSRAVADLAVLSEYCIPLLSKGGMFIAYKGGDAREEIRNAERAVKVLGGKILKEKEFMISGTDFKRTLVVVSKIDHTPKKFPRKAGMPKKSPIR
ncbi:MAG: 16S rRNA (guanine(527)-N(7))-methyltransferase RsmG [Lachnospiraceae bacterium]|nr:16S rRNA (guanine(527)-N(7))-methyltransferase RsmG [Lachnospiraceae bacterium]